MFDCRMILFLDEVSNPLMHIVLPCESSRIEIISNNSKTFTYLGDELQMLLEFIFF